MKNSRLTRRRFLQLGGFGAVGAIAVAAGAGSAETNDVVVERMEVRLQRLPLQLDKLTIAHLSDFHYSSARDAEVIRAAVRLVNELSPDIVVLTGDFVTCATHGSSLTSALGARPCARLLSELRAPMGIFAVMGNHDQCNPQLIARSLQDHGIALLNNRALHIERTGAHLWIAGVDDVLAGKARLDDTLRPIPPGDATVLLAHEPDFADAVRKYPVDLQLSGHSHGGQIQLPWAGAPYLPPLAQKYPYGMRQLGGLTLYTNRGLGTTFLPIRFNCPPEVTLLTLRSGAATHPADA